MDTLWDTVSADDNVSLSRGKNDIEQGPHTLIPQSFAIPSLETKSPGIRQLQFGAGRVVVFSALMKKYFSPKTLKFIYCY